MLNIFVLQKLNKNNHFLYFFVEISLITIEQNTWRVTEYTPRPRTAIFWLLKRAAVTSKCSTLAVNPWHAKGQDQQMVHH